MDNTSIAARTALEIKLLQHLTAHAKNVTPAMLLFHEQGWVTGREVQNLFDVSRRTLQTWRDKQLIPHSRIGKIIMYNILDMLEMLRANKVGGESRGIKYSLTG